MQTFIKLALLVLFICQQQAYETDYVAIDKDYNIIRISDQYLQQQYLEPIFAAKNFTVVEEQAFEEKTSRILNEQATLDLDDVIAVCRYKQTVEENGWNFLKIVTNPKFEDEKQGYAAGQCEGATSFQQIDDAYWNFVNSSVLGGKQDLPGETQEFISAQLDWMEDNGLEKKAKDPFWDLIYTTLNQEYGMYAGYKWAMEQAGKTPIEFVYFYHLTYMGDLEDVEVAFRNADKVSHSCNVIGKILTDSKDNITEFFFGHSTFNIYQLMLRVYKDYNLNYNNQLVVNKSIQFSARPGDLESKDDFYTAGNLVVVETSLLNWNHENYSYLHYDSLPCWIRCITANKVASTGKEWSEYFQLFRSGTHNNQWLIADYNKLDSDTGLVYLAEESFYFYQTKDMTDILRSQKYVASYNVPYHQDIFNQDNYQAGLEGFTYEDDPRAQLIKYFSPDATTVEEFKKLMYLNNDITGNPCGVPPSHAVTSEIAPRCDKMEGGGFSFGLIDGKFVNMELMKEENQGQAYLKSGPSTDGYPPFSWAQYPKELHYGMPEVWDFDWVFYNE